MSQVLLKAEDCAVGVPLAWHIYDQEGNVLHERGAVIATEAQLTSLLSAGALRELSWEMPAEGLGAATAAAARSKAISNATVGRFEFQDMRLKVGDRIQIEPPANVAQGRFIVKLIGYLDKVSLLVTMPSENGMRLQLCEDDKIVARVFTSQKAFGFVSFVKRVCRLPFDYLHLTFPAEIQGSIIRSAPRVRTNIVAAVARLGVVSGEKLSALILNVSAEGALLRAGAALAEKGETIQLSFCVHLHDIEAYLSVKATVRSVFADDAKGGGPVMVNHGLQFETLPANDRVILQSLVYQQMIEEPNSLV